MDTEAIIAELEAERDRLANAIAALQGKRRRAGRTNEIRKNGRRRRFSPAARKRISEAMKKRWAARKRAT